jgi:hypothetical protein
VEESSPPIQFLGQVRCMKGLLQAFPSPGMCESFAESDEVNSIGAANGQSFNGGSPHPTRWLAPPSKGRERRSHWLPS